MTHTRMQFSATDLKNFTHRTTGDTSVDKPCTYTQKTAVDYLLYLYNWTLQLGT